MQSIGQNIKIIVIFYLFLRLLPDKSEKSLLEKFNILKINRIFVGI